MTSSNNMSDVGESARWVRKTSLYRRSLEVKEEIARHKWYESEKAGHDIGWERASVDWLVHHGLQDEKSGKASA